MYKVIIYYTHGGYLLNCFNDKEKALSKYNQLKSDKYIQDSLANVFLIEGTKEILLSHTHKENKYYPDWREY